VVPGATICGCCQNIFDADMTDKQKLRVAHHVTAESFQAAIELGCPLCRSLWRRLRRGTDPSDLTALRKMSGTECKLVPSGGPTDQADTTMNFRFDVTCKRLTAPDSTGVTGTTLHQFQFCPTKSTFPANAISFLRVNRWSLVNSELVSCKSWI
jgi:hypothetical protein